MSEKIEGSLLFEKGSIKIYYTYDSAPNQIGGMKVTAMWLHLRMEGEDSFPSDWFAPNLFNRDMGLLREVLFKCKNDYMVIELMQLLRVNLEKSEYK